MARIGHIRTVMLSHLARAEPEHSEALEDAAALEEAVPQGAAAAQKPPLTRWLGNCVAAGLGRARHAPDGRWRAAGTGEDDEHATVRRSRSEASRFSCGADR